MGLDISERQCGAVTILGLAGRLTMGAEAEFLRGTVDRVFDEGHRWIVLDLGGVHGADSAGVGELVSVHASVADRGGVVKFLKPSRKLKEMFHVTRLEIFFETYEDEQDAVQSFGPGRLANSSE